MRTILMTFFSLQGSSFGPRLVNHRVCCRSSCHKQWLLVRTHALILITNNLVSCPAQVRLPVRNNLVNLVNRVNFLGLIPKCGVDQSDCKITFLSWPLSLKLFFGVSMVLLFWMLLGYTRHQYINPRQTVQLSVFRGCESERVWEGG